VTLTDWLLVLATFLGGGVIGSLISWQAQKVSERHADARHLRDLRADRLRATFKPLLAAAQVRAEILHARKFTMEGETTEQRDVRLTEVLRKAMEGFTDAMVAIQLEPHVGKQIADMYQETWRAWTEYQTDVRHREILAQQGAPIPHYTTLDAKEKKANDAVDAMQTEMLRLLDELEQPMPAKASRFSRKKPTPKNENAKPDGAVAAKVPER